MKDHRRKRDVVSWSNFFRCTVLIVTFSIFFTAFNLSTFRPIIRGTLHPEILSTFPNSAIQATSDDLQFNIPFTIRATVTLPDQVLIFLKYPPSARLFTKEDLTCVYISHNSSPPHITKPPIQIDGHDVDDQIVIRCPLNPRGTIVSLSSRSNGFIKPGPTHRWDSLVYNAMIDRDNTTIVFVKGLNLRPEKLYNASRFECVYGWDFTKPKFLLRSEVISIAQEIVRCKTPKSILSTPHMVNDSIKASIRVKGGGTFLHSIALPGHRAKPEPDPSVPKMHKMCVCTMLRNQARFLREWVMYHSMIGVERWFIYDNISNDDIDSVIESLVGAGFNISKHAWPWIKTQEAGFAHCALRARGSCEWVGFIDVDEFFNLPTGLKLNDLVGNQSLVGTDVGELRVSCYSFGPSGLKHLPPQGVVAGYTCRMAAPERHKSILKPEAMNSTLINVVHHFHLRDGFRFMNADRGLLVINHYKYQVWEVFKEKFYRRVATYVADWQQAQNVGSRDRAPGLGTEAVEPPDWSYRFCEVSDYRLRDRVLETLMDPMTKRLPWEVEEDKQLLAQKHGTTTRIRKLKGVL